MRRSRLAECWNSLWGRSRTSNGEYQRKFLPACFLRSNRIGSFKATRLCAGLGYGSNARSATMWDAEPPRAVLARRSSYLPPVLVHRLAIRSPRSSSSPRTYPEPAACPTSLTMTNSAPLTERRYVAPFILITSLFFLWAFGVNLNDILIPRFKNAFALSDFQSSFIQVAFFSGYCLAALPAGRLLEKIGYKRGILTGLALCASGALLFVPASAAGTYAFFLVALFVMACGQSFLEVAANPYVTIFGPPESSERRLNLAQSFNAVGAVCAMLLGLFILSGKEITPVQRAAFSSLQEQAYRTGQASSVRVPYALIACIFVVVALLIVTMHLPEVNEKDTGTGLDERASWKKLLQQGHLIKGVVAQFLYVGAQVGVGSFVIRFAQHSLPGLTARTARYYLLGHWIGFMLGRFGTPYGDPADTLLCL